MTTEKTITGIELDYNPVNYITKPGSFRFEGKDIGFNLYIPLNPTKGEQPYVGLLADIDEDDEFGSILNSPELEEYAPAGQADLEEYILSQLPKEQLALPRMLVVIDIDGGNAEVVMKSLGIEVVLIDRDIQRCDDDDGQEYEPEFYGAKDTVTPSNDTLAKLKKEFPLEFKGE